MTDRTGRLISWQRRTIFVLLFGLAGTASYARYEHYRNSDIPAHLSHALRDTQSEQTINGRLIHDQNALLKRYSAKYGALKSAPGPLVWKKADMSETSCVYYIGTPRKEAMQSDTFKAIRYVIKFGGNDDKGRALCELSTVLDNPDRTELVITREYGNIKNGTKALQRRAEEFYPLISSDSETNDGS